jgi:cytochrome c oxidase subunit 3
MLMAGIASIIFLFGTLSFLYIIRKAGRDWVVFQLPDIFWWSTAVIICSSLSLQMALHFLRKDKFIAYKWLTGGTLFLGIIFICTQLVGWHQVVVKGISLASPAGAFLFMLSGLHILHIVGGLVFLFMAFLNVLKRPRYVDAFVYSVNPPNQLKLRLVSMYWHFVDVLWLYLFLFLLYHHN